VNKHCGPLLIHSYSYLPFIIHSDLKPQTRSQVSRWMRVASMWGASVIIIQDKFRLDDFLGKSNSNSNKITRILNVFQNFCIYFNPNFCLNLGFHSESFAGFDKKGQCYLLWWTPTFTWKILPNYYASLTLTLAYSLIALFSREWVSQYNLNVHVLVSDQLKFSKKIELRDRKFN